MWPDERVVKFVNENFLPARVHVRDQAADFKKFGERYGAHWTPTTLVIDSTGVERHRIEGFLPKDDFLAQLKLGLAHLAFQASRWAEAERRFTEVLEQFPNGDAAAEAMYWAGVSRYKKTNDAAALKETGQAFRQRYRESPWAKKASIWQ